MAKHKTIAYTLLTLALVSLFSIVNAQTFDRKWNLGLFGGISIYAGDLGNNMMDFTNDVFNQSGSGGISLTRYLNKSFSVSAMSSIGSFGYYKNGTTVFKGTMLHGNFSLRYKLNNGYLIPENARLAPYILAGVGISDFSGDKINNGTDIPLVAGIGARLRLTDIFSVNYQATFGYMNGAHNNPNDIPKVTPTGNDMFMLHMLGLGMNLGSGKDADRDGVSDRNDKCPGTPDGVKVDENGCPLDKDGDGVADYLDRCPFLIGSVSQQGCPDADKDGIADMDDQCPNVVGIAEFKGCPDTDGDGIIDSKDKCPNVKGVLIFDGCPDTDGDGIRDEADVCPDVKGVAEFKGCPDTDGDGIEDSKDMCPLLKGPNKTNGCPDTDNDGVNDGIDKCVALAGSPEHYGCPDTDGDEIFDDIDKCISIPGVAANQGCPVIKKETKQLFEKALQGIRFETGKAIIKPLSYPILNAIVKVMKNNQTYKLMIGGHTDDVGEDMMNMTLSQDRASSVANYLITHGVDPMRVTATGYGETVPVDTNKSEKGRTRNRRVEFNVEFLK
jgi:hypothetical protein